MASRVIALHVTWRGPLPRPPASGDHEGGADPPRLATRTVSRIAGAPRLSGREGLLHTRFPPAHRSPPPPPRPRCAARTAPVRVGTACPPADRLLFHRVGAPPPPAPAPRCPSSLSPPSRLTLPHLPSPFPSPFFSPFCFYHAWFHRSAPPHAWAGVPLAPPLPSCGCRLPAPGGGGGGGAIGGTARGGGGGDCR